MNLPGSYTEAVSKIHLAREIIGAVTHTMVNAIFQGELFPGASHLGFSKPC